MQRTLILGGPGGNTLITNPSTQGPFYGPFGGCCPSAASITTPLGNGAYSQAAFSAVLSRLTMFAGYVNAAISITGKVNVGGGASPAGGNQSVTSPSGVQNSYSIYYYDLTDIDAIAAGQSIGLQLSTDRTGSGQVSIPHVNLICDSPNAGWCSPIVFDGSGGVINGGIRSWSNFIGQQYYPSSGTPQDAQGYTAQAYVASYLQWQSLGVSSGGDTSGALKCKFSFGPTWGSPVDSSMMAGPIPDSTSGGVQPNGYQMIDITDIAAVPAGSYTALHWSGAASNALKMVNAGIHIQSAQSNATWLGAGGSSAGWSGHNPNYCPFSVIRFDWGEDEMGCAVPAAGIYSNLAVQIQAYTTNTTFSLQAFVAADAGAGSGQIATNAVYNNTSIGVTFTGTPAPPCWAFDYTDIAAVTAGTGVLLAATATTASGVTACGQSINFTAPAHLGLTLRGAG